MEQFKKVTEFKNVEVSEFGRVRYISNGEFLKPYLNRNRYVVFIQEDGQQTRTISQLVAKHFIDNPNNYKYVCPKDGNINNCQVSNLKWVNCVRDVKAVQKTYIRKTEKTPSDEAFLAEITAIDRMQQRGNKAQL